MKIKSTFALLAISATMLLASCKKDNKKTDAPPVKKLKYLTRITIVQGTSTRFNDYIYDDKKRLITIKTNDGQTSYTYNSNHLFSVEVVTPSDNYLKTTECTYNNTDGTISSTHDKVYMNNTLKTETVFNYIVVNGRITERHYNTKVDQYIYDDRGNPTNADGSLTYDDKPNVYTNGFPNPNGLFFSPNNKTSDGIVTYTYTYGADGYPIGAIASGSHVVTTKYAYTYTEM